MPFSFAAQAEHTDEIFKDLVVQRQEITANEFYDCTFTACRFNETTFRACRFVNCSFNRCDLSLARVPGSSFSETAFEDCKLVGVDWTQASWRFLSSISLFKCIINYSIFTDLDLGGTRIESCVAEEADFRGTNLAGANLSHTDFAGSFFKHTVLEGADFSHARNYRIDVNLNKLRGAKFMLPEATALLRSLDIVLVE